MNVAKFSTRKDKIMMDRVVESVEIDMDFTQMYSCFYLLSYKVKKAASFKVLFYLMKILPKDNVIRIDSRLIADFIQEHRNISGEELSSRYFYMCLKDLQQAEIIKKLSTSVYFVNPYAFWKDKKDTRTAYIREDHGKGQTFAYNPLNLLLKDPEGEYRLAVMTDDVTTSDVEEYLESDLDRE